MAELRKVRTGRLSYLTFNDADYKAWKDAGGVEWQEPNADAKADDAPAETKAQQKPAENKARTAPAAKKADDK